MEFQTLLEHLPCFGFLNHVYFKKHISLTLIHWDNNGNRVEAVCYSLYRYLLGTYFKKCTLPNNQKRLVHKNKVIINARIRYVKLLNIFLKYIFTQCNVS